MLDFWSRRPRLLGPAPAWLILWLKADPSFAQVDTSESFYTDALRRLYFIGR